MAIPPYLVDHRCGESARTHYLELFLDYACPFSKKEYITIYDHVLDKCPKNISILFRQVPQPWHPSSTYLHEAAIAVNMLSKKNEAFGKFSRALFEQAEQFYDDTTYTLSRKEVYEKLAELAESSVALQSSEVLRLLQITTDGNAGNETTDLLKLYVKFHRQMGVHVTPTVAFDGLIDPTPQSSWSAKEWLEYLQEKSR